MAEYVGLIEGKISEMNCSEESEFGNLKFYLPPSINKDVPYLKNMLYRYIENEFPDEPKTVVYSIPKTYAKHGQKQACLAEEMVFQRLINLKSLQVSDLWVTFFHSTSYAGYSNRNQRLGKLMIREHDFVIFVKYFGQFYVILMEVKSTNDRSTVKENLELIADSKIIKNNKRSAQHQLRDHLEILQNHFGYDVSEDILCYILWPFLGAFTKDPKQQIVRRWAEEKNLHVFEHIIFDQKSFNEWFLTNVLTSSSCKESTFVQLLNRYVVLSCGVFMEEIDQNMLALLTQQQLELLKTDICTKGGSLVVHGIAGTGKTLLVLKKLYSLYEAGQLNEQKRALYICYWPGIRCEVISKLKTMGIEKFVDTARFYITSKDFLKGNTKNYKHVFMDEAEAICLGFEAVIVQNTLYKIYRSYHDGNCNKVNCPYAKVVEFKQKSISELINGHTEQKLSWGELWFMVDTNQALMFLPKHSPDILKTPQIVLDKVIRSTKQICSFFSNITHHTLPQQYLKFPRSMDAKEPPIFWVTRYPNVTQTVSEVIVDLCSTKGVKPFDICVIPFLQNEMLSMEAINSQICQKFVENAFKPEGVSDVEKFILSKKPNEFLVAWALRVKGLEFKVVVMVVDMDQFDKDDPDDRRKLYVIASRSTCMLVVIGDSDVKSDTGLDGVSENYPFDIKFD